MIGQENLKTSIQDLISSESFPRFSIFVGLKGSGKKTFLSGLDKMFPDKVFLVFSEDCKIDTIRSIIQLAYKTTSDTIYIIPDADNMSLNAKNALLKLTEEPPNNAYIILTLEDIYNTLETIRSRATVFYMENYSKKELELYIENKPVSQREKDLILELCETPGEIDLLISRGVKQSYDFVEKVVDNIAETSGSNVFKLEESLILKDSTEKQESFALDVSLFFKIFICICRNRAVDGDFSDFNRYTNGLMITSSYLSELRIVGISKPGLVDMWILDIRKEWMS